MIEKCAQVRTTKTLFFQVCKHRQNFYYSILFNLFFLFFIFHQYIFVLYMFVNLYLFITFYYVLHLYMLAFVYMCDVPHFHFFFAVEFQFFPETRSVRYLQKSTTTAMIAYIENKIP